MRRRPRRDARRRRRISDQGSDADDALRRGRTGRHHHPRHRRRHGQGARQAVSGGKHRWRRRHHRHRQDRRLAARRLFAPGDAFRPCRQHRALSQPDLRRDPGFRADRDRRRVADGVRRQEGFPGQGFEGADRAGEGGAGETDLRLRRHRLGVASVRPPVLQRHRRLGDQYSLQGDRPGAERSDRQPVRFHVRPDIECPAAGQGAV